MGCVFAEEPESGDKQKKQMGNPHIELREYHARMTNGNKKNVYCD